MEQIKITQSELDKIRTETRNGKPFNEKKFKEGLAAGRVVIVDDPLPEAPPPQGVIDTGLNMAGRALDYVGGLGRTAAANAIDPLTPGETATLGDFVEALKGNAPSGSDFLARSGVGEMGTLSDIAPGMFSQTGDEWLKFKKDGILDVSGRGAVGFGLETVFDPFTYATLGTKPIAKGVFSIMSNAVGPKGTKVLNALANPVSKANKSLGKRRFKKAFSEVDRVADRFGKPNAPSDFLFENKIWGRNSGIVKSVDDRIESLSKRRDEIFNKSLKKMAKWSDNNKTAAGKARFDNPFAVDMDNALSDAQTFVNEKVRDGIPWEVKQAEGWQNIIDDLRGMKPRRAVPEKRGVKLQKVGEAVTKNGKVDVKDFVEGVLRPAVKAQPLMSPRHLNRIKTSAGRNVPKSQWDNLASTDVGKNFFKKLAGGMRREVERSVGDFGPELSKINDEWGTYLTVARALEKEALKTSRRHAFTSVDGLLTGSGHMPMLLGKKAGDVLKTTVFKTSTGLLQHRIGQSAAPDLLLRALGRDLKDENGILSPNAATEITK